MTAFLSIPATIGPELDKAFMSEADALILDLTFLPPEGDRETAYRDLSRTIAAWRAQLPVFPKLYLRVHPLDHDAHFDDLVYAVRVRAEGVMLTACRSGMDVTQLAARLQVVEAEKGIPLGSTRILAEIAPMAPASRALDDYGGRSSRLEALVIAQPENGVFSSAGQLARMLTLLGGQAARLPVFDAGSIPLNDVSGLEKATLKAFQDGFSGKMALSVDQIAVIQSVFSPRTIIMVG